MAVRKRGLADGVELGQHSSRSTVGLVGALKQVQSRVVEVDVNRVAPNPENPKVRSMTGIEELSNSIQEQGLVQPITVCTREAYIRAYPQYAPEFDPAEVEHVVLDGDRRRVAALRAGEALIPAVVRDDLADDPDGVRLATALQRLALTPVQEARAYQRKVEKGMTQARIAAAAGVSQGQVTKRLALLRLPESIQVVIEAGLYPVIEGLNLLKEDEETVRLTGEYVAQAIEEGRLVLDQEDGAVDEGEGDPTEQILRRRRSMEWGVSLAQLTLQARRAAERARAERAAQAAAEELGGSYVPDAGKELGKSLWRKRLDDDVTELAKKLAAEGNLVIAPAPYSETGYEMFRRTVDAEPASSSDPATEAERARKRARKARSPFMERVLSRKPSAKEVRESMVELAFGYHCDFAPRTLAAKRWNAKHPKAEPLSHWDLGRVPPSARLEVAWWVYVYTVDAHLNGYAAIGAPEYQYLQELMSFGYTPAQDEMDAMAQYEAKEL